MTAELPVLPEAFTATRVALHAVAEQVVAAARYQGTARIGLVPTEGGFGTPAFGDDEVVRVDGVELVHERGGTSTRIRLTTLGAAAAFVGVPLGAPPVYAAATAHDPDAALAIAADSASVLANWYHVAGSLLSRLRVRRGDEAASSPQLWPEHFDLALELGDRDAGTRANFGASPGDTEITAPYLYVGPWDPDRRTGPFARYPFGAVVTYDELRATPDPPAAGDAFYEECARLLYDVSPQPPG